MMRSRFFAVLVGVVLAFGAFATPAAAHDALVTSDPADGAMLSEPPASVVLEFSGSILDLNPALEIARDGEAVEVGAARIEGKTVTWELAAPESLEAGEYAVVWAVTSQDGHPIDGSFAFGVDAAWSPEAKETRTPEPSSSPEPSESSGPSESPAPSPDPEAPQSTEDDLAPVGEDTLDGSPTSGQADLSQTAETWFFAGLVVTALVVIGVVVFVVRRNRDPNGPPGQH